MRDRRAITKYLRGYHSEEELNLFLYAKKKKKKALGWRKVGNSTNKF